MPRPVGPFFAERFALGSLAAWLPSVAAVLCYLPIANDGFALDDFIWLKAAEAPSFAAFAAHAVSFRYVDPCLEAMPLWRPMVDLYFWVARRLFGLNPAPYHAVNILLHAANATLLSRMTRRVSGSARASIVAGVLFAVYPAYNMAVTWISEISEVLVAFLTLACLVLSDRLTRPDGARRGTTLTAALVFAYSLSILVKQTALLTPALLFAWAFASAPGRPGARLARALRSAGPLAPPTAILGAAIFLLEYRHNASAGTYRLGVHALGHGWEMLRQTVMPFPGVPGVVSVILAGAFLVLGADATRRDATRRDATRRDATIGFGVFWTLLAIFPYTLFLWGWEPRYTYQASMPFLLTMTVIFANGARRLAAGQFVRRLQAAAAVAGTALTAALVVRTQAEQHWIRDQARAWTQLLVEAPRVCGALPEGAHVHLVDSPTSDPFGGSSRMALAMIYRCPVVTRSDLPYAYVTMKPVNCGLRWNQAAGVYESSEPSIMKK